jgi:hypothetical protein
MKHGGRTRRDEARTRVDRLYAFVAENSELVDQAMRTRAYNGAFMADSLRVALNRMHTTTATRQANIREFSSHLRVVRNPYAAHMYFRSYVAGATM